MKIQKLLKVLTLSLIACSFAMTSLALTEKQAEGAAAELAKKQAQTMQSKIPTAEVKPVDANVKQEDSKMTRDEGKKLEAQYMQEQKVIPLTNKVDDVKVQEVKREALLNVNYYCVFKYQGRLQVTRPATIKTQDDFNAAKAWCKDHNGVLTNKKPSKESETLPATKNVNTEIKQTSPTSGKVLIKDWTQRNCHYSYDYCMKHKYKDCDSNFRTCQRC